jgi:3-oxoacyl-(acyl-carrier-protein) synthase
MKSDLKQGLVGGANLFHDTAEISHFTHLGFLSPDGVSYSFDQRADGYSRGEGFAVVVIKMLSQALRDGDTIRAVLRATGSNQDGRTPGITQPSSDSQAALNVRRINAQGLISIPLASSRLMAPGRRWVTYSKRRRWGLCLARCDHQQSH